MHSTVVCYMNIMNIFSEIQFLFGSWRNLAILFVLSVATLVIYGFYKRRTYLRQFIRLSESRWLLLNYSPLKQILKAVCMILASISLAIALLGPAWDKEEETVHHEGRDVCIALDISRSMLAQDNLPNRLEFAKQKIKQLIARTKSDRISLILFAANAFMVCPLTHDYEAFFSFLSDVDQGTVSASGTDLSAPVKAAIDMYKKNPEKKHKLLIIVSDGEDSSGTVSHVSRMAAEHGIHLLLASVGSFEGAPIPLSDQMGRFLGHVKDDKGAVVISKLNKQALDQLAQESQGLSVVLDGRNDKDLQKIQQNIEMYEKEKFEEKHNVYYQNKYFIFTGIGFLLLLIEWLL